MNPLDIALQEAVNTIAQLQARLINLAIENAALKAAAEAKKKDPKEEAA